MFQPLVFCVGNIPPKTRAQFYTSVNDDLQVSACYCFMHEPTHLITELSADLYNLNLQTILIFNM